jgi:hypothetical protein
MKSLLYARGIYLHHAYFYTLGHGIDLQHNNACVYRLLLDQDMVAREISPSIMPIYKPSGTAFLRQVIYYKGKHISQRVSNYMPF